MTWSDDNNNNVSVNNISVVLPHFGPIYNPRVSLRPQGCHYVEAGGPRSPCDQVCKSCSDPESGARRPSGATWGNCTSSHTCFSGVVTTSTVECPTPMCADPVTLPGQCCPSCPTKKGKAQCRRGLQPFAEGETKDDITDPCNECTCDKGHLTW